MTEMIAERGAAAAETEGAEASSAARRTTARARTGGRTQQGTGPGRRAATRVVRAASTAAGPEARAATAAASTAAAARKKQQARRQQRKQRVQQKAQTGAKTLTGNYHGVVFGEFVLAVLLVAAIPFSKPNRTGVSPYAGRDMIQLLAITVLYFLLAVLAATGRTQARFAAWFGGLILLAVGLAEAASIASAVSSWFGTPQQAATTSAPAGNASVVNPGSEPPTGSSRPSAQDPGTGLN